MNFTRRSFLGSSLVTTVFAANQGNFSNVRIAGKYPLHLQGVCTNHRDRIYWSFTDALVTTDLKGNVLTKTAGPNHLGDLCYKDGKLYVAVNLGLFNDPQKRADSWVYVYKASDLTLLERHKTPEAVYGAGGIAEHQDRFMVVGGLPEGFEENYLFEYDRNFKFIRKHTLHSGYTRMGIQTAAFSDHHWWFGCYGAPEVLLKADKDLRTVQRYEFSCSLGIVPIAPRTFLIAKGACVKGEGCSAELVIADADEMKGLSIRS